MGSVLHTLRTEVVRNPGYAVTHDYRQTIAIDIDDEMKNTRKLLERVPLDDGRRDYKPHEKSMPLDRLATHVAELPSWPKLALDSELFELQPGFKPRVAASHSGAAGDFRRSVAEGRAAIAGATDGDMEKNWTFTLR